MVIKERFLENFIEQLMDPDDVKIDIDTNFRDLDEWDSMTGMAILVMIQDEYSLDLPADHFRTLNTVGDIFDFVKENYSE